MLGLIIGAGILCVIVAVLKDGELKDFETWEPPGCGALSVCVLAAYVPAVILVILERYFDVVLPSELFFVGAVAGTFCTAGAIALTCRMSIKRSVIATVIFLAARVALSFAL